MSDWDSLWDSVTENPGGGWSDVGSGGSFLDSISDSGGSGNWGSMGDVFGDSGGNGGGDTLGFDLGGGNGGVSGGSIPGFEGANGPAGGNGGESGGGGGGSKSPWGALATKLLGSLAGTAISAGATALGAKAFPDTPSKIIATDARTAEGRQGDAMRLQGANLNQNELNRSLGDPYAGSISPEQQKRQMYEISRQIRKANSAAGMLETGGGVAREQQALDAYRRARELEHYNYVNSRFNSIPQLTSGFNQEQLTTMPGVENPWQKIIAAAGKTGGDAIGKAIGEAMAQWVV